MVAMDSYLEYSPNSMRVNRLRGRRWLSRGWRRTIIIEEPVKRNRKKRYFRGYPVILIILALGALLYAKDIINKFQEKTSKIKDGENVSRNNMTAKRNLETTIQMGDDASRTSQNVKSLVYVEPVVSAVSKETNLDSSFLKKRKHSNDSIKKSSLRATKTNDAMRTTIQPMTHSFSLSKIEEKYTNKTVLSPRNYQGSLSKPSDEHSNNSIINISTSFDTVKTTNPKTTKRPKTLLIMGRRAFKENKESILAISTGLHVTGDIDNMQTTKMTTPHNEGLHKTIGDHLGKNQTVIFSTNDSTLSYKTTPRKTYNSFMDISTGLHVTGDIDNMPSTEQQKKFKVRSHKSNMNRLRKVYPSRKETVLFLKTTVERSNVSDMNINKSTKVMKGDGRHRATKPYTVSKGKTNAQLLQTTLKHLSRDSDVTKKSGAMLATTLPMANKIESITLPIEDYYDSLYDMLNITPEDKDIVDPFHDSDLFESLYDELNITPEDEESAPNRDSYDSVHDQYYKYMNIDPLENSEQYDSLEFPSNNNAKGVFSIGSTTVIPNKSITTEMAILKKIKPNKMDEMHFIMNLEPPFVVLDEVNLKIIKERPKRMHVERDDIPALNQTESPYILLNEINLKNMDPIPLALPKKNITELILTAMFKRSNGSTPTIIKSLEEAKKIKNYEIQNRMQQKPHFIMLNEINLKDENSIPVIFPLRNDSDLLLTVTFKHSNNTTITASGSLQETMKSNAMQTTKQPKFPQVLLNKINLKPVESMSPVFLLENKSDFSFSTTVKQSNNYTVTARKSSKESIDIEAKQTKKQQEKLYIVLNEINLKQLESIPVLFPLRNDSDFLFTATFQYANESSMATSGILPVTKKSIQTTKYLKVPEQMAEKIKVNQLGSDHHTVYSSRNDTGLIFKTIIKQPNVSISNISRSSILRKESDPMHSTKYRKLHNFILNSTNFKYLESFSPSSPFGNNSDLLFTIKVKQHNSTPTANRSSQETDSTAKLPEPADYDINKANVDQIGSITPLGNDFDRVFPTTGIKSHYSHYTTVSLHSNSEEQMQVRSATTKQTTKQPKAMMKEEPLLKYNENNIDIKDYDLLISYNTTHLWGEVSLTIVFYSIMDKVVLHFEGDEVTFPTVFEIKNKEKNINSSVGSLNAKVRSMMYDHKRRRIIIKLIDKMNPGNNYVYKMNFTSTLNRFERGAALINYFPRIIDHFDIPVQRWTIGLYLFPSNGKKVFPCIEAPHRRSTFHLKIKNRGHDLVTSNTIRSRTSDRHTPKNQIDDFERTPAIPVSSFAFFILPNYNFVTIERKSTPSLVIWYPEKLKYSVEPLVPIAASSLDFFYQFFQYEIPTQQISIVVGEGIYSDPPAAFTSIVISSKYIYENLKGTYESTDKLYYYTAKQFCNLWLGNIVNFNSWNDNWIKEGFSMYMAHLAAAEIYPDYDISSFIMRIQDKAFKYHRFSQLRTDNNNIPNMNKSVISGTPFKAAFLFHMAYKILKPNDFREGIRTFFKNWALKSADPGDLWNSFNIAQSNIDIAKFVRTWSNVYYYPILNVELNNKKVIIEQIPTSSYKYEVSSWWIPINYISSLDYYFDYTITHWMKEEKKIEIRIHLNPSWIVINPGHSAFFRTNYTDTLWRAIAIELTNKYTKIPSSVKAQILDDAFTLASDGLLDYAVPMTMAVYLSNEVEFTPWATALKHFRYIANFLMDYPEWQLFQKYVSTIMLKISEKLGLERENDSAINGQLRKLLMEWSCLNELPNGCVEWAGYQFQKWKNNMTSLSKYGKNFELRGIIYCIGVKIGADDETNFLYIFSKMQMITLEEEMMLLRAVTCSESPHTFEDILADIFNVSSPTFSIVRLEEFWQSLGNSQNNLLISFKYIKYNWPLIYKQFHGANGLLNIIIEGSTYFLKTKTQLKEVIKLRDIVPQNDYSLLTTFDYTIDQISSNINWEAKYSGKVRRWLRYNQKLAY